jgi:OOP family OmpA-OmpF porin
VAEASPDSGVVDALAHFAFDSAELTEAGRGTLDAWLAHAPVGMPVVVSGYADRLGPEPYNLDLSLRRAMAARDYLVARGKDARDIRIHAKGENEPVKNCRGGPTPATKACLAPNRRVVIVPE